MHPDDTSQAAPIEVIDYSTDADINAIFDATPRRPQFYEDLHPTRRDLNLDLSRADMDLSATVRIRRMKGQFIADHADNPGKIRAFRFYLLFQLLLSPNLFAAILAEDPSLAKAYNQCGHTVLMCISYISVMHPRYERFLLMCAPLLQHGADPTARYTGGVRDLVNHYERNETLAHHCIRTWRLNVSWLVLAADFAPSDDLTVYLKSNDESHVGRLGWVLLATELIALLLKRYPAAALQELRTYMATQLAESKEKDVNKGQAFAIVCERIERYIAQRSAEESMCAISLASNTRVTKDSPAMLRFSKADGDRAVRTKVQRFLAEPSSKPVLFDAQRAYHAKAIADSAAARHIDERMSLQFGGNQLR